MTYLVKRAVGVTFALIIIFTLAGAGAAFAGTPTPEPSVTSPPLATNSPLNTLAIVGQIMNGTPGGSLPVTTTVTLVAVDGQTIAFTKQGTANWAGVVRYDDVEYRNGRTFALVAAKGTVQYHTELTPPSAGEKLLTFAVKIYDSTPDQSQIRVSEMYVAGQFLSQNELQIINAYIVSNDGDRAVEGGTEAATGQPATLRFYLPAGATNVEFQGDDGKKFLRTEDGYVTTWGVPPGTNVAQVAVRYTLPYSGQLHLESRALYPVQKVSVLMAEQGITLTSPSLADQGTKTGQDGVVRRLYLGNAVPAGQSLAFDLSGSPKLTSATTTQGSATNGSPTAAPAATAESLETPQFTFGEGIIALGLLTILAACIWYIRALRSRGSDAMGRRRALLQTIADLDEDYVVGKIDEEAYADRRAVLKAALVAALKEPALVMETGSDGQT